MLLTHTRTQTHTHYIRARAFVSVCVSTIKALPAWIIQQVTDSSAGLGHVHMTCATALACSLFFLFYIWGQSLRASGRLRLRFFVRLAARESGEASDNEEGFSRGNTFESHSHQQETTLTPTAPPLLVSHARRKGHSEGKRHHAVEKL